MNVSHRKVGGELMAVSGIKLITGDCMEVMRQMDDDSVDLVFGSPPYCDARAYGINAQRKCLKWVEWMLAVTTAAARVCRGPVLWVAGGVTRKFNYWPACEGLMWEWWKRGGMHTLYRPCIYHRVGIPGSGGKDWFRKDEWRSLGRDAVLIELNPQYADMARRRISHDAGMFANVK